MSEQNQQNNCTEQANRYFVTGVDYYKQGDYLRAIGEFKKSLQHDVVHADSWHLLGISLGQHGDLDQASECIERAITVAPDISEFHFNLGKVYKARGEHDLAQTAFSKAIELDDGNAKAHNEISLYQSNKSEHAAAVKSLEISSELNANDVDTAVKLASAYIDAAQYANAVAYLEQVIKQFPLQAELVYFMGVAHQEMGDPISALKYYQQTIQLEPNVPEVYNRIGVIYYQVGEFDMAIDMFRLACEYSINYAKGFANLGNALLQKNDTEQALAVLEQALKLEPESAEINNNYAAALQQAGQYDEAIEYYHHAIACDPYYTNAYQNLADLCVYQEDIEAAISVLEQAACIVENKSDVYLQIGKCYLGNKQLDEALENFRCATQEETQSAEAYKWIAKTHWVDGAIDLVQQDLDNALQADGNDVEAHVLKGALLLLQGNYEQGLAEYQWRWHGADYANCTSKIDLPVWQGEDISDKSLLIWFEDEISSNIFSASLLTKVQQYAKKIVVLCKPMYDSLLRDLHPDITFIHQYHVKHKCDMQIAVGDLMQYCCSGLDDFKHISAYFTIDQQAYTKAKNKYRADTYKGKLVGVCLAQPDHDDSLYHHSPQLQLWQKIVDNIDARFIEFAGEVGTHLLDKVSYFVPDNKLNELAADLSAMDVVITVDDKIAHLAGAMGKEVYLLLPNNPEWYWQLEASESICYPSVHIYRYSDGWDQAVNDIIHALV